MNYRIKIILLTIISMICLPLNLFSQKQKALVLGVSHERNYLVRNIGLNLGLHYEKQYSQLNIAYNYYYNPYINLGFTSAWFFNYWDHDKSFFKQLGFGYTHRYYPNKKYSRFASFLEGNLSYSQISGHKVRNSNNLLIFETAQVNIISYFVGYGISFNFLNKLTFLSSFGIGTNLTLEKYKSSFWRDVVQYRNYDAGSQLKFSILYHIKGFE